MNKDNGNQYKNQDIYIVQFPEGRELSFSQGEIQSIQNERIEHLVSIRKGSSGSPILVLNNQEFKVIGIHKNKNKDFNLGIFMKNILNDINKDEYENKKNTNEIICEIKIIYKY